MLTGHALALFGAGFGFVVGYADLICLARYQAFGTMMTGNLLMIAKNFVEMGFSAGEHKIPLVIFYALIIVARNLGIFLHRVAPKLVLHRQIQPAVEIAPIMFLVIFVPELYKYSFGVSLLPERWNVWFVALVFGMQRDVTRPAMGTVTMVATTHLSLIFATCMEVFLGEKNRKELRNIYYPLANTTGIFVGAMAGAWANMRWKGHIGSSFLLTPITTLQLFLMILAERMALEARKSAGDGKKDDFHNRPGAKKAKEL